MRRVVLGRSGVHGLTRWDIAMVAVPFMLITINAGFAIDTPRPSVLVTGLGVTASLALLWRRFRPVQVVVVEAICSVVATLGFGTPPDLYSSFLPAMIAICALAAYRPLRYLWLVASFCLIVYGGFALRDADFRSATQLVFNGIAVILATAIGRAIRLLRQQVATESSRADLLSREQDVQAREAVIAERERIARELHDVIAHDVSVMVIQAGAAQRMMSPQPEAVTQALDQVQLSGRRAVEELYLLLGMLREDDQTLAPQPGLSAVEELLDEVRRSGVTVGLTVTGDRRELGTALDLSVYRLVQEALTNVMKHARGSQANVELNYMTDGLSVRVTDDGGGAETGGHRSASGGNGLLGMRERVRLFGGTFSAGALPNGGWSITAVLPASADI